MMLPPQENLQDATQDERERQSDAVSGVGGDKDDVQKDKCDVKIEEDFSESHCSPNDFTKKEFAGKTPQTATTCPLTDTSNDSIPTTLTPIEHQDMWHFSSLSQYHASTPLSDLPPYSAALSSTPVSDLLYRTFASCQYPLVHDFSTNLTEQNYSLPNHPLTYQRKPDPGSATNHLNDSAEKTFLNYSKSSMKNENTPLNESKSSAKRLYNQTGSYKVEKVSSRKSRKILPKLYGDKVVYATNHQELDLRLLPHHAKPPPNSMFVRSGDSRPTLPDGEKYRDSEKFRDLVKDEKTKL